MDELKVFKTNLKITDEFDDDYFDVQLDDNGHIIEICLYDQEYDQFEFDGNLLHELSLFIHLKKLEIAVSDYTITDLSGLSNLKDLEHLVLEDCCNVDDISALADLKKLTHLSISNAGIKSVAPLKDLHLLTNLILSGNELTSIDELKNHTNLSFVSLPYNKLNDISALAGCNKIKSLIVGYNNLNDISFLSGFNQLEYLSFENNKVQNIEFLHGLPNIKSLMFSDNPVKDFSPLSHLSKLQQLYAVNIPVNDLNPIKKATGLTHLEVGPVKNFNGDIISQFENLVLLKLQDCNINNITFLTKLNQILNLNLDNNKIDDLTPFAEFVTLRYLSLKNNLIQKPTSRLVFMSLNSFDLTGNKFGNKRYGPDLYKDIADYWYEHGDDDKALAYHYIGLLGKVPLIIYYKKLLSCDLTDSYYRLYYTMMCYSNLKSIQNEDDEVTKIRGHIIEIVKNSSFFNRNQLLLSLEKGISIPLNYNEYSEYTAYLNSGYDIKINPGIFYKLSSGFHRREDLNRLLSLYKQLYNIEHPLYLAIYQKINKILRERFASTKEEREAYEYNRNLLFHINDHHVKFFDTEAWFKSRYGDYVHDEPKRAGAKFETHTMRTDNSGLQNVLRLLLIATTLLALLKACNIH